MGPVDPALLVQVLPELSEECLRLEGLVLLVAGEVGLLPVVLAVEAKITGEVEAGWVQEVLVLSQQRLEVLVGYSPNPLVLLE